jgi:hypothetical protein
MQELMKRCDNFLHVGWLIFRNEALRGLWVMLSALTKPHRIEHSYHLELQSNVEGGEAWLLYQVQGHYAGMLAEVLDALQSEDDLVEAGLLEHSPAGRGFLK